MNVEAREREARRRHGITLREQLQQLLSSKWPGVFALARNDRLVPLSTLQLGQRFRIGNCFDGFEYELALEPAAFERLENGDRVLARGRGDEEFWCEYQDYRLYLLDGNTMFGRRTDQEGPPRVPGASDTLLVLRRVG